MLMLATAALHFGCALTLFDFARNKYAPARHAGAQRKSAVSETLRRSPYLLEVTALVVSVSIAAGLIDFLFKSQAAMTVGTGATLTRFFATFYIATSLLGVLVQAFATSDVLSRLGLAAAVSSLPLAVTAGGAGVLMAFDLAGLTVLRGIEVVLRGSLFRSGYELFFTPVSSADKRAVKSIIDVGGERLGDALGSGIVAALLLLSWSGKFTILGAAILFSCAGVALARRLERAYVRALETSLARQSSGMEEDEEPLGLYDSMVMPAGQLLVETPLQEPGYAAMLHRHPELQQLLDLSSADEGRVIHTLSAIDTPHPIICHQLVRLLASDAYAFLAMDKLRKVAARNVGLLADCLLDQEESFAVRRRLPLILAGSQSQRALYALVEALSDPEFQIRFRSANAIGQLLVDQPRLHLDTERIWGVLGAELQVSREVWERRRLLGADSPDENSEAPGEASLEYLFALLRLLLPRETVSRAYRALQADDRHLRGTALEYLQTVLPANTWKLLNGLISDRIVKPGA
jgi:hypothetical protein